MNLSETYSLIDAIFKDKGLSDNSSKWALLSVSYTVTDDGITLANATGGTRWVKPQVNGSDISLESATNYCIEVDIKNVNATNVSLILVGKTFNITSYLPSDDWASVKIYTANSKVYLEVDGVAKTNTDRNASTEDILVRLANGESYKFKNFVLYPI